MEYESTDGEQLRSRWRWTPWLLVGTAAAIGVVLLVELVLRYVGVVQTTAGAPIALRGEFVVGVLTTVPFVVGIAYGGVYLARSRLPVERYSRILTWTVGGTVGSLAINGLLILVMGPFDPWLTVAWLRWAFTIGTSLGLFIGLMEARAIDSTLEAEGERMRAEYLRSQRDTLDYLNSLLRHEVLNGINVVQGHGKLLEERFDESAEESRHVEPIVRRSEDIAGVVSNVRRLVSALEEDREPRPIRLRPLLEDEVEKVQETNGPAVVEAEYRDDVVVAGDEMLGRVFGNLLENAIVHNDGEPPRVSVTVSADGDRAVVEIADDGPGIDPATREVLFERPEPGTGDHGFGLYLVQRLCQHYGGELRLTETGPSGTTFTVTLPRSDDVDRPLDPQSERR